MDFFNSFNVMEAHGFNTPNAVSASNLVSPKVRMAKHPKNDKHCLLVYWVAPTQKLDEIQTLGLLVERPPSFVDWHPTVLANGPIPCHPEITWHS
jgi:Icc-related predicted phosphoesterase